MDLGPWIVPKSEKRFSQEYALIPEANREQAEKRWRMMMRVQRWVTILALIVLAGSSSAAFARTRSSHTKRHDLRVTLLVYNYAHVPSRMMRQFENDVDQIFSHAGVEITWVDCSPSTSDVLRLPECLQILSPTEFALRVLPLGMSNRLRARSDSLGVAWPCPISGSCAGLADVFYDRVADQAAALMLPSSDLPILLSAVAAHEIGHLLLGAGHHTVVGLMRSPWDMRSVLQEQSFFTSEQTRCIQKEVQKRMNSGETLWAAQPSR
jgi:hypothetical protein